MNGRIFMIAIPQCLDFANDESTREICDFYLKILERKNKDLYMHSQQVANYSASTAAKLGLPLSEVATIKTAALLHDIGHLSVPNLILYKAPFLTTREQTIYKRHCIAGASMLENISEFSSIAEIIRAHHEQWQKTHDDAIVELKNKAGLEFDPAVVKAFVESIIPQPLPASKTEKL